MKMKMVNELSAFPSHVHWEGVDYDRAKLTISDPEQVERDRMFHEEAGLATAEKGRAMIDIAVDWVAEKMGRMIG